MVSKLSLICLLFSLAAFVQTKEQTVDDINKEISNLKNKIARINWEEAYEEYKGLHKRHLHCDKKCPHLHDFEESKDAPVEVDYIVAGGGIAGTVLANRLSESLDTKVMLIERGKKAGKLSQVPGLFVFGSLTKYADRKCLEPQRNFGKALEDHRVIAYGGQAMGGFSTLSSGRMSKGLISDFTSWGEEWCPDKLFDYFKKSEKANLTGNVNSAYHNYDGRLSNKDNPTSKLGDAFINCGLEKGFKLIDSTGDLKEGFSKIPANLDGNTRQDHNQAFLDSILYRKNLIIKDDSQVYKILINDQKVAYGVKYVHDGKIYTVKAKKEVIISHGTFGSPKLLIHSGIGPCKDLKKYDIKCIQDLPVGKEMHDQISYVGLGFSAKDCPESMHDIINNNTINDYINYGQGPLSIANNVDAISYKAINSKHINVMYRMRSRFYSTDKGNLLRKTSGISKRFYKKYFKRFEGKRMCSIVPTLVAKSKGSLKLKSNNPFEDLRIYGNYFSHHQDKKDMVAAIIYLLDLINCTSMKKLDFKYHDEKIPECKHEHDVHRYWHCAVEYLTVSNQDFVGTCKMGDVNDTNAVVDRQLKVRGIKGLRIVDSSVYPGTVTGPTSGVTTMIAEKAASMIKLDAGISITKVCGLNSTIKEDKSDEMKDKDNSSDWSDKSHSSDSSDTSHYSHRHHESSHSHERLDKHYRKNISGNISHSHEKHHKKDKHHRRNRSDSYDRSDDSHRHHKSHSHEKHHKKVKHHRGGSNEKHVNISY